METNNVRTESNDIVMLRLYNGEMIMGRKCEVNPGEIRLEDPRMVVMVPTMRGDIHVAMKPVCAPFSVRRLEAEVSLRSEQVMFSLSQDEIDKELVNGYKSDISGIKIASAADTMAIATGQQRQGGDFVLE